MALNMPSLGAIVGVALKMMLSAPDSVHASEAKTLYRSGCRTIMKSAFAVALVPLAVNTSWGPGVELVTAGVLDAMLVGSGEVDCKAVDEMDGVAGTVVIGDEMAGIGAVVEIVKLADVDWFTPPFLRPPLSSRSTEYVAEPSAAGSSVKLSWPASSMVGSAEKSLLLPLTTSRAKVRACSSLGPCSMDIAKLAKLATTTPGASDRRGTITLDCSSTKLGGSFTASTSMTIRCASVASTPPCFFPPSSAST
eukprot:1660792-Rhodomonas_salina.1